MKAVLLPCPFCGSANIDRHGWSQNAGMNENTGPLCNDCGATAETVERWNIRPLRMQHAAETMKWAVDTFGEPASLTSERTLRFTEEVIEFCHAVGISLAVFNILLGRVYRKPQGSPALEFGQVCMTLDALAYVMGADPDVAAREEFIRVKALPPGDRLASHHEKIKLGIATPRE